MHCSQVIAQYRTKHLLSSKIRAAFMAAIACSIVGGPLVAADPSPQLAKALSYKPRQPDVPYDEVTKEQMAECNIEEVKKTDGQGFLVTGAAGQPLRWFVDTNDDKKLDRWSYFHSGVEIYRESDTDFNGTADEYRWLSTAGLRWGVDKNEDGEMDSWKQISAEEVTLEAVKATATRDEKRFKRLLISEEEIAQLGLGKEKAETLLQKSRDAAKQFRDWSAGQNAVSAKSQWANFGADKPGVVPAGTDGSTRDITVYENTVALVEDGGDSKQLIVGTLIQVGDKWRLIDLPRAVSEGAIVDDSGVFFSVSFSPRTGSSAPDVAGGLSKAMERLVADLQEVDAKLQEAGTTPTAPLHAKRADVIEKLISASTTPEDRSTWIQQFADTVSAAAQAGDYPEGIERLDQFMKRLPSAEATKSDMAYVAFRTLTANHNHQMQSPNAKYDELQKQYLEGLRSFVTEYPESADAAEAMIQIALAAEFTGESKEAAAWYAKAAKGFSNTAPGKKAEGALRRLNLVGQPFNIKGKTIDGKAFASDAYKGGPVVYHCWASWCEGCKAEMRALKELQTKYARSKLHVVGINLDNSQAQATAFLKDNPFPWAHLHDQGGLDSTLAVGYGILTLPANFVVDENGKVVATGVHWSELDAIISKLAK